MTTGVPSIRERAKALPVFFGFVLLGAVPLWLALSGLIPVVRAIDTHAPLVALSARDPIGFPLALLCFALAGLALVPPAAAVSRPARHAPPMRSRRIALTVCLAVAIASVFLTIIAVPVTEFSANIIMAHRHYLQCPPALRERHPPMRWVLPQGQCP